MDTLEKRQHDISGATQFRGTVVTTLEKALVPHGGFSTLQNVRNWHPGFQKREGATKHHSTSEFVTKLVTCPIYNQGSNYATGNIEHSNAVWATVHDAATGTTANISTEDVDTCRVRESGGTYYIGRTFLFFDFTRVAGVISAANLMVRIKDDTNLSSVIAVEGTATPDLNDSSAIIATSDFDSYDTGDTYSAEVDLTGYATDAWATIALDSTFLTAANAMVGAVGTAGVMAITVLEYTYDFGDTAPAAAADYKNEFYMATAGSIPYLSLTMSTSESITSMFQISKGKRDEKHFLIQTETGDVLEATDDPPATTTGDFGTLVHQPRDVDTSFKETPLLATSWQTALVPASWNMIADNLVYSDGLDQHKFYTGQEQPITTFLFCKADADINKGADYGADYSFELTDDDDTTFADVSSMGDLGTDNDAIFIRTQFKANKINIEFETYNGTASVGLNLLYFDESAGTFLAVDNFSDGTASGGTTFAQDGSLTWDTNFDEIEFHMAGENGYWYMLHLDAADSLDADVKIKKITYEGAWQSLENVWDGVIVAAVEVYHYSNADAVWYGYPYAGADISSMATADELYFSSIDNLVGFHMDFGATPNLNTTTTISAVYGWDGDDWVDMGETDYTSGMDKSGYITWKRNDNIVPREFQGSKYRAYWWKITIATSELSDDVVTTITTIPWFKISQWGQRGNVSTVWKERVIYTFDRYPSWLYISGNSNPNGLNGSDYAILQAGDGRQNAIVAAQKFHNELMVWQEEHGPHGGCLTLFQGYNPATFGRLLLSAKIGSFSQKSTVVVDGAQAYTRKDDNVQTLAFFISHYGIFVTDGATVTLISRPIQNYFDNRKSECIRLGYEKEMYVEHDSTANVLRFGLVSGASATKPNIFPIFDLEDWTWSFDTYASAFSSIIEVEATTGQYPVLQMGGGATSGYVYRLNDGTYNDDGTAVDMQVDQELNFQARHIDVDEVVIRYKPVTGADLLFKAYEDGILLSSLNQTIDMDASSTESTKRERILCNLDQASNITLSFQNNENKDCFLFDILVDARASMNR
jgi:hypothetical protein